MKANEGRCPRHLRFTDKRVHVVLRNGYDTRKQPLEKAGWKADGKGGCNWSLTGGDWDIMEWELTA